ncbi:hypothetical protein [Alkalicoccobacillus gibsonii]|uniref:hypothetical protein n=1 Tax=Alkalicoccobacillus gibsonii TaxID=79881 RepID=UPI00351361E7
MKKVEKMDKHLEQMKPPLQTTDIQKVVQAAYKIDLNSKIVQDHNFTQFLKENQSGQQIRQFINQTYGINLDAISALEGSRISLYSKNQWIVQDDQDLFVVWTGIGDVDVKVYPTDLYKNKTNTSSLPSELKASLQSLGYQPDEQSGGYYYKDPAGQAVPDSFKGQTMGAIMQVVRGMDEEI